MSRDIKYCPKNNLFKSTNVCIDTELGIAFNVLTGKILGQQVDSKAWSISKENYHSSGWGRSSSGDYALHAELKEIKDFLRSFGFKVYEMSDCSNYFEATKSLNNLQIQAAKIKNEALREAAFEKVKEITDIKIIKPYCQDSYSGNRSQHLGTVSSYLIGRTKRIKAIEKALKNKTELKVGNDILCFYTAKGELIVNAQELQGSDKDMYLDQPKGMNLEQYYLRKFAKKSILLPLNVFKAANLDLSKTRIVERGDEERILNRHFTGAMLLENSSKYYLFDLDRNEVKHGIFNAFLSNIPTACNTIKEAYESLKPEVVKQAEIEGTEVKRQGEWFLIKRKDIFTTQGNLNSWQTTCGTINGVPFSVALGQVRQGKSRPNNIYLVQGQNGSPIGLGTISHTGREHKTLDLGCYKKQHETDRSIHEYQYQLWDIVPNTAVGNFTIQGNVD